MPPARKAPANLAAARKKRHPAPLTRLEQFAAQENLAPEQLPAASLAATTTSTSPPAAAGSRDAEAEGSDTPVVDLPLAGAAAPSAAAAPPVAAPPVAAPPVADPPVADPPVADPPVTDPPVTDPPASCAATSSTATAAPVTAPPSGPADPPRHRKPSGRAPRIGLDGPEAEWDYDVGCWRSPSGSVHDVMHNKKRKLTAEAQRALCVQIDSEICDAAGCVPTQRGVVRLLVVSESDLCKLDPRVGRLFAPMPCIHSETRSLPYPKWCTQCDVGGCPKHAWGEELWSALEYATPGCKIRCGGRELELIMWREGGYWQDVEGRLDGTAISVNEFQDILHAAIKAEVRLECSHDCKSPPIHRLVCLRVTFSARLPRRPRPRRSLVRRHNCLREERCST
jgi:hypothetical protein